MKKLVTVIIILLAGILLPKTVNAVTFPITELGNCSNQQDCFHYCQAIENTPACWSYETYILHKGVLGDATSSAKMDTKPKITFPIAELGNCATPTACKAYCAIATNHDACTAFGKRMGLIKIQTTDNGTGQLLKAAKTLLGCDSMESCRVACDNPDNRQKCEQVLKLKRTLPNGREKTLPPGFVQAIEQQLGCNSNESCRKVCNQPENAQKCKDVLQRLTPSSVMNLTPSGLPCKDSASCAKLKQLCQSNPEKCRQEMRGNTVTGTPSVFFKQGCTTASECHSYCKEHPTACPGFAENKQAGNSAGVVHQTFYKNGDRITPSNEE